MPFLNVTATPCDEDGKRVDNDKSFLLNEDMIASFSMRDIILKPEYGEIVKIGVLHYTDFSLAPEQDIPGAYK